LVGWKGLIGWLVKIFETDKTRLTARARSRSLGRWRTQSWCTSADTCTAILTTMRTAHNTHHTMHTPHNATQHNDTHTHQPATPHAISHNRKRRAVVPQSQGMGRSGNASTQHRKHLRLKKPHFVPMKKPILKKAKPTNLEATFQFELSTKKATRAVTRHLQRKRRES
jgi:hypothetical protein